MRRSAYRDPHADLVANLPRMVVALVVIALLSVSLVTCGLDAMSRVTP